MEREVMMGGPPPGAVPPGRFAPVVIVPVCAVVSVIPVIPP
jgi:hypothetical protein